MSGKIDILSDKDNIDKKRRKITSENRIVRYTKEEIYTNVTNFEKKESIIRSAEDDVSLFYSICEELRGSIKDITKFKKNSSNDSKQKIEEKRKEASLSLIQLKKINRLDKVRIVCEREALQSKKLSVDSNRLQLHNLLYEDDHLRQEGQRCYTFKSQDEDLKLVPSAEFYNSAPEDLKASAKASDHAERLSRLEFELMQRKMLNSSCNELRSAKENVAKEIISKTERLDSLAPKLNDLFAAALPIQEILSIPESKKLWKLKTLYLLSPPLYLLYAKLNADPFTKHLTTQINGDENEAKQINKEISDLVNGNLFEDIDDYDSDEIEKDDIEEMDDDEKRRSNRKQTEDAIDTKRDDLFKAHPLSITVTINKEKQKNLAIIFRFLYKLDLVTVQCILSGIDDSGIAAGDVLAPENILNGLYPNDTGEKSPNPVTESQLEKLSLDPHKILEYLQTRSLGKPYKWAQHICNIQFIPLNKNEINEKNKFPNIMQKISNRFASRLKLYKQILLLENGSTEILDITNDNYAIRISNNLLQWTSISFDDYEASNVTDKFIRDGLVDDNDIFYRAIITRGSAKLECYICINCNYPNDTPVWALSIDWNGKKNAETNSSIREMEFWINNFDINKKSENILQLQLHRARTSLDVFLETEGSSHMPNEFGGDRTFLRSFRGRQRSRPFKLVVNEECTVYRHTIN